MTRERKRLYSVTVVLRASSLQDAINRLVYPQGEELADIERVEAEPEEEF